MFSERKTNRPICYPWLLLLASDRKSVLLRILR
jgi:hypothetical protein